MDLKLEWQSTGNTPDLLWARATLQGRVIMLGDKRVSSDNLLTFLPFIQFANHNSRSIIIFHFSHLFISLSLFYCHDTIVAIHFLN